MKSLKNLDDNFEDAANIKSFNEYYYRAILYEFDLNKRSITFVNQWKKVCLHFFIDKISRFRRGYHLNFRDILPVLLV